MINDMAYAVDIRTDLKSIRAVLKDIIIERRKHRKRNK